MFRGQGVKQKLEAARAAKRSRVDEGERSSLTQSCLVTDLLMLWSSGELSARGVQRLAAAACIDGLCHDEIAEMASLGNHGQLPGNIARDLYTKSFGSVELCEPHVLRVPCLDNKATAAFSHAECAMMLPHMTFASMYQHHREEFMALMTVC